MTYREQPCQLHEGKLRKNVTREQTEELQFPRRCAASVHRQCHDAQLVLMPKFCLFVVVGISF